MLPVTSEKALLLPGSTPASSHGGRSASKESSAANLLELAAGRSKASSPARLGQLLTASALVALVGSALTYGLWPAAAAVGARVGAHAGVAGGSGDFQIRKTCPAQPKGRISNTSQWVSPTAVSLALLCCSMSSRD